MHIECVWGIYSECTQRMCISIEFNVMAHVRETVNVFRVTFNIEREVAQEKNSKYVYKQIKKSAIDKQTVIKKNTQI